MKDVRANQGIKSEKLARKALKKKLSGEVVKLALTKAENTEAELKYLQKYDHTDFYYADNPNDYSHGVWNATITPPKRHNFLSIKKNGRTYFPKTPFTGWWTYDELEKGKKKGYKIQINRGYACFELKKPFPSQWESPAGHSFETIYKLKLNLSVFRCALRKLFKNNNKIKHYEKKLFEFLDEFYDKNNEGNYFLAGLPDFIIITNNDFCFAEVKSYSIQRKEHFFKDNRMNIGHQKHIFSKIAKKYKLYICLVEISPKSTTIVIKPYTDFMPIINRRKTAKEIKKEKEREKRKQKWANSIYARLKGY